MKRIKQAGLAVLVAVWAALALWTWFHPAEESSQAERRTLAQLPQVSGQTLLSGRFMEDFESYTLDQFPVRDTFRQLKALVHYGLLRQKDNNGIYICDGYAAELEYPLDTQAVSHALERLNWISENYLSQSDIYCAVVPDKGYYLARENGYPSMDYEALFSVVQQALPQATHIDLTDCLDIGDYYYTDTHWRQECILPAAQKIAQAMGVTAPQEGELTKTLVADEFYGVYYGHAALPMDPEPMYIMENELLSQCTVLDVQANSTSSVYDLEQLDSTDMYNVFLSGVKALLKIENPNASTKRELIVFRDSFGSSMTPLLLQDYATVTVVDLRYINYRVLEQYLNFRGKDVLFLFNTQVLNTTPLM